MTRLRKTLNLCILLSAAFASLPLAAATVREFPIPTHAFALTAGPDGAVWLTISDATALGRVAADGTYKTVDLPASPPVPTDSLGLRGITLAPDGSLWAAAPLGHSVFRLSPSGVTTQFSMPNLSPYAVTPGPGGSIWFAAQGTAGKITSSGQLTVFSLPTDNGPAGEITTGPDGNLWLTDRNSNGVVRLAPNGSVVEFLLPDPVLSGQLSIQAGFNDDLWFTEVDGNRIGRLTTNGVLTEYTLPHPGSQPSTLVKGPDGNMWFTEAAGRIGRITPQGAITEINLPAISPSALAAGPDGNLWFAESSGFYIGRLTLGGTLGPCVPGDTVLCLDDAPGDRRFKVEVEYSTEQGGGLAGNAHAVPLASLDVNHGGLFWFFSQENPELLIKLLDGCADNGHRWVFLSGGTNVGLIATVADTMTHEVHTYYNRDLKPFAPVQDTKAHACVP